MKPLISVIVPIYKTELFLEKCLSSIVNQTMKEIEIICVNDCSPDNSSAIVKRFAKQDPRVILIEHTKNLGLGGARNTALRIAKADYIASVDSDDYIKPKMMETLWEASEEGLYDIVVCGFERVDEEGNLLSIKSYSPSILQNKNNDINIFSATNPAFWNKLWRKSLYIDNDIFFPEFVYYQDLATTPRILAKANTIKFINDCLVCYLIREDSATYTRSGKHIVDYLKVFEVLRDFLIKEGVYTQYKYQFREAINNGLRFHAQNVSDSAIDKEEKKQYLRYLLMMRVAFLDLLEHIEHKDEDQLLQLLSTAETKTDLALSHKMRTLPISVLVKTFLRPKMLLRFLCSIGDYQKHHRVIFDEVLVGDDSTERIQKENRIVLSQVIDRYPSISIRMISLEKNSGLSMGRNTLVSEAKNEVILLCDDDFIIDEDCFIEDALEILREQNVDILGGWLKNNYDHKTGKFSYWGAHGEIVDLKDEMIVYLSETAKDSPDFVKSDFLLNFYLAKRTALQTIKWDPELKIEEHYDFFLRFFHSDLSAGFTNKLFAKHTNERKVNPKEYTQHRFERSNWEHFLFKSIEKLGKKRRSVFRWRDDHFVLWQTDYEKRLDAQTKLMLHKPILNAQISARRLTPAHRNYFVGYYDIQAVSSDGQFTVSQTCPAMTRLPTASDTAALLLINCLTKETTVIAQTTAWCHQQGAHLQFLPGSSSQVVYNIDNRDAGRYQAKLHNIQTHEQKTLPLPISACSPDGIHALSLNFARLYDYRPGYGYGGYEDCHADAHAPKDDGIHLLNMQTNEVKLIVSYYQLQEFLRNSEHSSLAEQKLIVNHVAFNTDGSKIFFLLRTFSDDAPFPTFTMTVDVDGKNLTHVFGFCSHYHWKDRDTLVVSGAPGFTRQECRDIGVYELNVETGQTLQIGKAVLEGDGHCSYSPDRQFLLYDSYSNKRFPYRKLQVYDLAQNKLVDLGYFWSAPESTGENTDCRCDLHPRWSPDGKTITFDSTHEGYRGVYSIDVSDVRDLLNTEKTENFPSEKSLRAKYQTEYLEHPTQKQRSPQTVSSTVPSETLKLRLAYSVCSPFLNRRLQNKLRKNPRQFFYDAKHPILRLGREFIAEDLALPPIPVKVQKGLRLQAFATLSSPFMGKRLKNKLNRDPDLFFTDAHHPALRFVKYFMTSRNKDSKK